MKILTVKRCIMSSISLLIVVFVYVGMSFALTTTIGVSESGYQVLDFHAAYAIDPYGWMSYVLGGLAVAYLVAATALLVLNVVAFFLFDDKQLNLMHFFTIGISAMLVIAFTLEGLVYTILNIVYYRAVFLTLAFVAILPVAALVVLYFSTAIFLTRALKRLGGEPAEETGNAQETQESQDTQGAAESGEETAAD